MKIKPKYRTSSNLVRTTLFVANGNTTRGGGSITFERRHDRQSDNWYPAASFLVSELPDIQICLAEIGKQVGTAEQASTEAASGEAASGEEAAASSEDEPSERAGADPPFVPDPPKVDAKRVPGRAVVTKSKRSARLDSRPDAKKKKRAVLVRAKGRTR